MTQEPKPDIIRILAEAESRDQALRTAAEFTVANEVQAGNYEAARNARMIDDFTISLIDAVEPQARIYDPHDALAVAKAWGGPYPKRQGVVVKPEPFNNAPLDGYAVPVPDNHRVEMLQKQVVWLDGVAAYAVGDTEYKKKKDGGYDELRRGAKTVVDHVLTPFFVIGSRTQGTTGQLLLTPALVMRAPTDGRGEVDPFAERAINARMPSVLPRRVLTLPIADLARVRAGAESSDPRKPQLEKFYGHVGALVFKPSTPGSVLAVDTTRAKMKAMSKAGMDPDTQTFLRVHSSEVVDDAGLTDDTLGEFGVVKSLADIAVAYEKLDLLKGIIQAHK